MSASVATVVNSASDRDRVIELLKNRKPPYMVSIKNGKHRSIEQNRLQRLWINEAAEQLGEYTAEQYRAYCKLCLGVPILRNEDDDFRKAYDKHIRPHSYEDKLEMMAIPLDFPVTRLMKMGQKKRYLDDVFHHFSGLGVLLTEPDGGFESS